MNSNLFIFAIIKDCKIYQCEHCQHQFIKETADYEKIYNDSYFNGAEGGYPNYLENADQLIIQGQWYANLLKKYIKPGHLLDVGAASGHILKGFTENGWTGVGLEPNKTMVDYGRKVLGLTMVNEGIETFETKEKFDLVTVIQVISHLSGINVAIEKAAEMTKPGGLLLIETWRRDSLVYRLSGMHWHEYNPPSVRHWFLRKNVDLLVSKYGYSEISHGMRIKKIKGNFSKSMFQHPLLRWMTAIIPNQINIPYPGDDLFWSLYEKN